MYAIMHLAVHDALQAVEPEFEPYTYKARVRDASASAAVAAAASTTLLRLVGELGDAVPARCS